MRTRGGLGLAVLDVGDVDARGHLVGRGGLDFRRLRHRRSSKEEGREKGAVRVGGPLQDHVGKRDREWIA